MFVILNKLLKKIIYRSKLKKAKFIHIIYNDKFNQRFVDFINSNFSKDDHLFLCKNSIEYLPQIKGDNVFPFKKNDISNFSLKLNRNQRVICHSLFPNGIINFLLKNPRVLKKTFWMIFGGDLYDVKRNALNDYIRSSFYGYIVDVDDDIKVLTEKYSVENKRFFCAGYTFPVSMEMINSCRKNRRTDSPIVIQINNSCDKTTIDMMKLLSKFKDENIIVKTVLSYGNLNYKNEIIKIGNELFPGKFKGLEDYMTPEKYADECSNNDILILNQNRQQGLGNSFLALQFGQKLFIKSEISTYAHLKNNGCFVFDTNSISSMSFKELIYITSEQIQTNIKMSEKFFSDSYLKELWEKVFNYKE